MTKWEVRERPCKYCGFVAARFSDEDCPAKPPRLKIAAFLKARLCERPRYRDADTLTAVAWEVAEESTRWVRIVLAVWLAAWVAYWILREVVAR